MEPRKITSFEIVPEGTGLLIVDYDYEVTRKSRSS